MRDVVATVQSMPHMGKSLELLTAEVWGEEKGMAVAPPPTVLVVNDDLSQLRLSTALLEKDGYRVVSCQGAAEALQALHVQAQIDVLVIDLHMPHIDGWRLCRLLRSPAHALFNHTPILIMSATFAGADAEEITVNLGANAFLPVPYEPSTLRTYIRTLLRGAMPQATLHVLISMPNAEQATTLRNTFVGHGYRVSVAATGRDSQRVFLEQTPDIVILDHNLPDRAADGLLQTYKHQHPGLVAIMLTTEVSADLAVHWLSLGADAYVQAPFTAAHVLDLCEKARRERSLLRVEAILEARTQALRESEQRFRLLFDSLPEIVVIHDDQGMICHVNAFGAQRLGWTEAELRGKRVDELFLPPADAANTTETPWFPIQDVETFEAVCLSRTEHWIDLEVTGQRFDFAGVVTFLRVARDITAHKQALTALQAAKDYAENVIHSSLDMIISCDTQRRITEFNAAAEQVFGYRKDEVLGQSVDILYANTTAGWQVHKSVLQDGYSGEVSNKDKWGKVFRSYLSAAPLRDSKGQIVGVMGVSRDITQEVELRARVQQAKKLEAIGQLAGGVAHDFNNLLAVVLGYANLLKLDATPQDRVFQAADQIERAAERGAVLTQQLLGFARQGKYQHVAIDLHKTVLDVIVLLSSMPHTRISITQRLHATYTTIMGDPSQIQQAMMQLVLNACDAMPEGGDLVFSTEQVTIEADGRQQPAGLSPGAYTRLTIADTGVGMPPEVLERIFEPFFTTKAFGQGTGMGLAMVYGIVKNHGGFIYVDSTVGSGTTFTIYFPVPASVTSLPQLSSASASPRSRPRLLVVEEDANVQTVAVEILQRLGYEAVAVASAQAAIEYYRQHQDSLALVMLDMHMSSMSAQECLRALMSISPHVKVMLSTGYDRHDTIPHTWREGVLGVVQKPYNLQQMASIIQQALDYDA